MFRSRRPVPSEAALRILRQLAYISSGTACGAAAIIAEERRRQISVASKIADNSRRLKQHPRYQHAQVALRQRQGPQQRQRQQQQQEEEEDVESPHAIDIDALRNSVLPDVDALRASALPDVDAFRSSVLPSEVDKDYSKYSQRRAGKDQEQDRDAPSTSNDTAVTRLDRFTRPTPPFQPANHPAYTNLLHLTERLFPQSSSINHQLSRLRAGQALHSHDLRLVCHHMSTLPANADPHDVDAFYLALFFHVDHDDAAVQDCKLVALQQLAEHGRLSSARALFASIVKHQGREEALSHLDRCCRRLVTRNRPSPALDLFVTCTAFFDLTSSPSVLSVVLLDGLFDTLLQHEMFSHCQSLLEWMHQRHLPVLAPLHNLLRACSTHEHHHHLLLSLYHTFARRYAFPNDVFPALCQASSKDRPSVTALIFMKHVQQSDRDSVLACCKPAWPAILERMWAETHNLKLIDRTYHTMCQLVAPLHPTLDLCNAMIRICIDAGHMDQAHEHLRQIQHTHHMSPNIVTFGHFVLGAAKSSDWPAIDEMMLMLTRAEDIEALPESRNRLFIPVLREYTKQHGPVEIWKFVSQAIDQYGVLPDQKISDIVTDAFLRARDLKLMVAWINHMRTHGLDARPTSQAAYELIRRFYFQARPSHSVLMSLCHRLVRHVPDYMSHNMTSLLREAVAYDLRSWKSGNKSGLEQRKSQARSRLEMLQNLGGSLPKPKYWWQLKHLQMDTQDNEPHRLFEPSSTLTDNVGADSQNSVPNSEVVHSGGEPSDVPSSCGGVSESELPDWQQDLVPTSLQDVIMETESQERFKRESEMLVAMSLARDSDTVVWYKKSLAQSGLPRSSYSLDMAVQAHIEATQGGERTTEDLVQEAQYSGFNITSALLTPLIGRVQASKVGSRTHIDNLFQTVLDFYQRMGANNITINHHLATSTASLLVKKGKAKEAIRLLARIYESPWTEKTPFDMPAMTVFLQAYIKAVHCEGIVWVMECVADNDYRIDRAFLLVLRRALKWSQSERATLHASAEKLSELNETLSYWLRFCERRQKTQIVKASRFGNELVAALIKLSKAPADIEAPSNTAYLDPKFTSGQRLMDKDGQRFRFRCVLATTRHERLKFNRLGQHLRRKRLILDLRLKQPLSQKPRRRSRLRLLHGDACVKEEAHNDDAQKEEEGNVSEGKEGFVLWKP